MSDWLIGLVTVCYLGVAADQAFKANWPMVLVWVGYAIANVGMIWSLSRG